MNVLIRFAILFAVFGTTGAAWAAWEPEKPVEFVVPEAAGVRIDQMARLMQDIISKHKLMKQDLVVVNKSGGAGAEAFFLLKRGQADPSKPTYSDGNVEPHRIMIGGSSLLAPPFATGVPFNWKDVSPVVMLALEPFLLWTHADDRYESAGAYVNAAKAAGANKRMRGTGSKQEDQYLTMLIERATGTKFVYVPFKWTVETSAVPLRESFDSALYKPMEGEALWRAGTMTPQCVFNDARLSNTHQVHGTLSWHDIPTCKEARIAVSYQSPSFIIMGPGVTDEQLGYFVAVFKKVVETAEWKTYMERGAYSQTFVTGQELRNCLARMEDYKQQFIEHGFISKEDVPRQGPTLSLPCI